MIKAKRKIAFQREAHKRRDAARTARVTLAQSGRVPRIAKLVALASRMQSLLESGQVESFRQLAELGKIRTINPETIKNIPGNKHKYWAILIFFAVVIFYIIWHFHIVRLFLYNDH